MSKLNTPVLIWLVGIALTLLGCAAQPVAAPPSTTAVVALETPVLPPTATPEPTPTATRAPTATPEPTPTSTPDPTATTPPLAPATSLTATLNLDNPFFAANPPPLTLKRGPEDHFQNVGSVQPGDEVTLLGRIETGSKVLVRLPDGTEGWAWRHVFTANKDAGMQLPVVEAPTELYDEEKIARIEFGGALDPAGRYETYLKDVIRQIQAADKDGSAPIPNTMAELVNAPGYAQWAAAFEAGVGYPAEKLLEQLQTEDWLYPTYGAEYAGKMRILVYVSEDQQGLIGWDAAGYLPKYIPVINIPKHYLDRALAGDKGTQDYIYRGLIKEMFAAVAGQVAAGFDPNGKYDPMQSGERLSLYALSVFMRQQGYPSDLVAYVYDRAVNYIKQGAKTGRIQP